MNNSTRIKYPRRAILRKLLVLIGKIAIRILTKFDLNGNENFPKSGPYIVAGNHVASLETMLMVLYTPKNIELLGTGDIPIDPNLALFANLYGYIPIFRGSIDQTGLKSALSVLKQNGVIGIFPEGGIWGNQIQQAKIGVSWLSEKSGAPVVPVGFIGMKGALANALRFKRPRIGMNIGKAINPKDFIPDGTSFKQSLIMGAEFVMERIKELLPEEELIIDHNLAQKTTELNFFLQEIESEKFIPLKNNNFAQFSILLNQPVLMDVFIRNLKLPVKILLERDKPIPLKDFLASCNIIINYLKENPGFLSYRLGMDTGLEIKNGLEAVVEYLSQFGQNNFDVIISEVM